jgi:hypothetical protein
MIFAIKVVVISIVLAVALTGLVLLAEKLIARRRLPSSQMNQSDFRSWTTRHFVKLTLVALCLAAVTFGVSSITIRPVRATHWLMLA